MMIQFIRKHSLLLFFGLALLLSWAIWIPLSLDRSGLVSLGLNPAFVLVVRLFGTLGPAVSAICILLLTDGWKGLKSLFRQLFRWRFHWTWYAAAGLVFPVLLLAAAGLYRLLPGAAPLPIQSVTPGSLLVTMIVMTISVLGEELGWRGFALPRLQQSWTALQASLILGTIWTIWHLPFWYLLGELEQLGWTYWLLGWAWILAGTIYITWLMNNTGNGLLLVVLFHWSFNVLSVGFLPATTIVPIYRLMIVLAWIIVAGVLGHYGSRQLVRRKVVEPSPRKV